MKSKIFNFLAFTFSGVLLCLAALDVNGKWAGFVDYNGNAVDLTYNFKTEGSKLTGTLQTPYGESPIADGKIDQDKISFSTQLNGTTIPQTGKVYQDSIVMMINYQGNQMQAVLKRVK